MSTEVKVETRGRKTKPGSINYVRKNYPSITQKEMFQNLSGKGVSVDTERWYNLKTNRIIKVIRGRTYLVHPRVTGEIEEIQQFITINNLSLDQVIVPEHLLELAEALGVPTPAGTVSSIDSHSMGFASITPGSIPGSSIEFTSHSGPVPVDDDPPASSASSAASPSPSISVESSPSSSSAGKQTHRTRKKMKTAGSTADIVIQYPGVKMDETIVTLNQKTVTVKGTKWYNLETSRQTGNVDEKMFFVSPRVVGTTELLARFIIINELDMERVIIPDHLSGLKDEINMVLMKQKPRIIGCTDIDKMPQDEIDRLQPFSFTNVTVPAIITYIIDGDTIDCAMVLDPCLLAIPTPVRVGHRTTIGQTTTVCSSGYHRQEHLDTKMLLKLRIRLDGVDAADCLAKSAKATPEQRELMKNKKEAATEYVRIWANGSYNKVWLQLMGYDCRSRILGRLYQRTIDGHKSRSDLTSHLLRYTHPSLGKVAVPYDGGNKKEAWKDFLT